EESDQFAQEPRARNGQSLDREERTDEEFPCPRNEPIEREDGFMSSRPEVDGKRKRCEEQQPSENTVLCPSKEREQGQGKDHVELLLHGEGPGVEQGLHVESGVEVSCGVGGSPEEEVAGKEGGGDEGFPESVHLSGVEEQRGCQDAKEQDREKS